MKENKPHREPFHYKFDSSGRMESIVERFLRNAGLDETDLHYMRWYVWQFADAYLDNADLGVEVSGLDQRGIMEYVNRLRLRYGINPFS
jgi:tyrosyl-tRNA synthetase